MTLTASTADGDTLQIKNIDANNEPIVVPDVSPYPSACDGQFIQMDVVKVVPVE